MTPITGSQALFVGESTFPGGILKLSPDCKVRPDSRSCDAVGA